MKKIVRVITPPEPIVLPADIAGSHAEDDAAVAGLIQAVTEELDGPTGWLGRCLGPQTLEIALSDWPGCDFELPFPPTIKAVSVAYIDENGAEKSVDDVDYEVSNGRLWFRSAWSQPSLAEEPYPVRIQYDAGYDGEEVANDGTGPVPERARQAIILSVQNLKALGSENLFLRSEEVEGVGKVQYTVSEQAGAIIKTTCQRLLNGLKVYR